MPTAVAKTQSESEFLRLVEIMKWKYGGPRALWDMKQALVEKLIQEAKLRSITAEWSSAKTVLPTWDGTCGGIRLPHFHLRGEVYPVSESAWHTFTSDILKDASRRLDDMKNQRVVSFEDVADAASFIAK